MSFLFKEFFIKGIVLIDLWLLWIKMFFLREFQLMTSALDNNILSSDQNTNQFLV